MSIAIPKSEFPYLSLINVPATYLTCNVLINVLTNRTLSVWVSVWEKTGLNLAKGPLRKVGGPKPIVGPPTFKSGWAVARLAPPIPTPLQDLLASFTMGFDWIMDAILHSVKRSSGIIPRSNFGIYMSMSARNRRPLGRICIGLAVFFDAADGGSGRRLGCLSDCVCTCLSVVHWPCFALCPAMMCSYAEAMAPAQPRASLVQVVHRVRLACLLQFCRPTISCVVGA